MKKSIALCAALAFGLLGERAIAAGEASSDRFEIKWLGPVQVLPQPLSKEMRKSVNHVTAYRDATDLHNFTVVASRFKRRVDLDSIVKSFDPLNCKSVVERSIEVGGAQVREKVATDCKDGRSVRARFFAKGERCYQVIATLDDNGDWKEAESFLDSFKMIDK